MKKMIILFAALLLASTVIAAPTAADSAKVFRNFYRTAKAMPSFYEQAEAAFWAGDTLEALRLSGLSKSIREIGGNRDLADQAKFESLFATVANMDTGLDVLSEALDGVDADIKALSENDKDLSENDKILSTRIGEIEHNVTNLQKTLDYVTSRAKVRGDDDTFFKQVNNLRRGRIGRVVKLQKAKAE